MPICLVILSLDDHPKDIFDIADLFFIKVTVEAFRRVGPAQCFTCQYFGHGSSNCEHPLRCLKCMGNHKASNCPKTREQSLMFCNCSGEHNANIRGCLYYQHTLSIGTKKSTSTTNKIPPNNTNTSLTQVDSQSSMNYAKAVKGDSPPLTKNQSINTEQVKKLLLDLLTTIAITVDPNTILTSTIK